jgi:hypothetical protein
MSFFATAFLWASLTLSIPILIALWNRKQIRREDFGGFLLLRNLIQSTQRRLRLLELLKLLNRLALIVFLILIFAEPLKRETRLTGADDGFALILDVGRVMQAKDADGQRLIDLQWTQIQRILDQLPPSTQGAVLLLSDRCEPLFLSPGRLTASSEQWRNFLRPERISYVNAPTTAQALTSCLSRVEALFEKKEVLSVLISPLPGTLGEDRLKNARLKIEKLPTPSVQLSPSFEIHQDLNSEKVRMIFSPPDVRDAKLIHLDRAESLGEVNESLDLLSTGNSWLWVQKKTESDPWANSAMASVQKQKSFQVTLWSQKESPGFLSLASALRNYPEMKVSKQIGGEPSGNPVIIYGTYPFDLNLLKRAWFFVDVAGQLPFKMRDQKHWSSGAVSADVERSFHIQTQEGKVLIKKYALFDLDQFDILESFEDGAPSLLLAKNLPDPVWISPFDLEDLTTDLTLESSFIPYLYRHLEAWLSTKDAERGLQKTKPIWLMPGSLKPTDEVIKARRWPGIYGDDGRYIVVEPVGFPSSFLSAPENKNRENTREEEISQKEKFFKPLVISLFLELLLCLVGARALAFVFLLGFSLGNVEASVRKIPVTYFKGIDADRKLALDQVLVGIDRLSNLEFAKAREMTFAKIWEAPVVLASSTKTFGPFSKEEREKIRDYCERGGFLLFDDPLATGESSFYQSVKKELAEIFPGRPFKTIPRDDIIFRTFYMLSEVSGRKLASPNLEGVQLDRRWVAIFSFNDLLGSRLRSPSGDFALSVSPYGMEQRNLARRLFLNLMMYSVAGDYKDDAIHLPFIRRRRVR